MLYEVITIPELEDAAVRIWKKRNHTPLAQPSEALLEIFNNVYRDVYARQGVITSYSIHYTKLYDFRCVAAHQDGSLADG